MHSIRFYALSTSTDGNKNTAVGYAAGYQLTTGYYNTFMGDVAGYSQTTASFNTLICRQAGYSVTTGSSQIHIGQGAGYYVTTGSDNTMIGYNAGAYSSHTTTGVQNICIGNYSRTGNTTRAIVIGYDYGGSNCDNTFNVRASSGSFQSNNSSSWSTTSDRRIKKNIINNNSGLDLLEKIQVRNFEYKTSEEIIENNPELEKVAKNVAVDKSGQQIGVIAQELEEVLPESIETSSYGIKTVNSDNLVWYLVNAVKELSVKVKALEAV